MKNLFSVLILILAASNLFAEEYLECKPNHAVKWQLEDDNYGGKKGFTELDVTKMSDAQLTLVKGLAVFLTKDYPMPNIMVQDFIDRYYNGKAEAISYRPHERQFAGGIQMILEDPDCSEHDRSKFSAMYLDVDTYVNQIYDCECLSEANQAKLFD